MKRTLPLFVLIAAIGLLIPVFAVFGKPPSSSKSEAGDYAAGGSSGTSSFTIAPTCCPQATVAKSSSDNDKVIDELTAILKETKSSETFIVTAMVLGRMGPDAKRALPIIIRNAERLELLDDLYKTNASAENRAAAQEVVAALEMILDKKAGAKGRIWTSPAPPTCYTPAIGYGTTMPSCVPAAPTKSYVPDTLPPKPSAPQPTPTGASLKSLDPVPGTVVR